MHKWLKLIKNFGKGTLDTSAKGKNVFMRVLKNSISVLDIKTLWHIVTNPDKALKIFSKTEIAIIIASVIYVITPVDAFPDWFPGGLLDDMGVITFILNQYGSLIQKYKETYLNNIENDKS